MSSCDQDNGDSTGPHLPDFEVSSMQNSAILSRSGVVYKPQESPSGSSAPEISAIILSNNKPKLSTSFSFFKVPAVPSWGTTDITPTLHSGGAKSVPNTVASVSRPQPQTRNIRRDEPCFITKSASYTHERAHWVNAVRNKPEIKEQVENLLVGRRIVLPSFKLDDATNLVNLDRGLHTALDKYAFFAVTASLDSLNRLIALFEQDNNRRQTWYDNEAQEPGRFIQFLAPPVSNVQYELVVLRPKHFLPDQSVLTTYDRSQGSVSPKTYVIGPDGTLRESPGDDINTCPRFPPFTLDYVRSTHNLNPFLVILNAEIKFRRYLRENPALNALPPDVMTLIDKTKQLVELIYWDPEIRPNTYAAQVLRMAVDEHPTSPQSADIDMEELGMRNEGDQTLRQRDIAVRGRPGRSATLEEGRDYGQYLPSGRDLPDSEDEFSSVKWIGGGVGQMHSQLQSQARVYSSSGDDNDMAARISNR